MNKLSLILRFPGRQNDRFRPILACELQKKSEKSDAKKSQKNRNDLFEWVMGIWADTNFPQNQIY